jgi:hypothetical protein
VAPAWPCPQDIDLAGQGEGTHHCGYISSMSLPPDPPPAKPKFTTQQRQARLTDRLMSIRLRMMIGRELDDRGITTPAGIGAALDMPPAEAVKLLTRHQWRDGDVALLQAAAARLGLPVAEASGGWPTGHVHQEG